MPHIVLVRVLIENEVITVFVDRVVCQVHAEVTQVAPHWRLINLCCKTSQPLMVDESPKRVDARDQNIDAQIELQFVYQVRLV